MSDKEQTKQAEQGFEPYSMGAIDNIDWILRDTLSVPADPRKACGRLVATIRSLQAQLQERDEHDAFLQANITGLAERVGNDARRILKLEDALKDIREHARERSWSYVDYIGCADDALSKEPPAQSGPEQDEQTKGEV